MQNNDLEIIKRKKLDCEHLLGTFLNESHYDHLITSDTDLYAINDSFDDSLTEKNIILKFRKNVFSKQEVSDAYDALYDSTNITTNNRGMASGPRGEKNGNRLWVKQREIEILQQISNPGINFNIHEVIENTPHYDESKLERGNVWVREKVSKYGFEYDTFFDQLLEQLLPLSLEQQAKLAKEVLHTCISSTTYANVVHSSTIGFFDRYPRFPYGRICSYNETNPEKFVKCYPYMRTLDKYFKELVPQRYFKQLKYANAIDPKFRIGEDTVFTTITSNRNFRTAAHRDGGDLNEGFSNITTLSKSKEWSGGFLVLPEFSVAIDFRPGDLLLVNNHEGIHGNTELFPPEGKTLEEMERISIVCYFRENMKELGSYEYEMARKDFVETRRLNSDHSMWFKGWNGVSPFMFETPEWKQFLETKYNQQCNEWLTKYHPKLLTNTKISLEDFF
jgi:hypothetical protein